MKGKIPAPVYFAGPAGLLGYLITTWLLENDPDHWLMSPVTAEAQMQSAWPGQ